MNPTKFLLPVMLLFAFSLPTLAESETRDLEGFDAIEVGGGINLNVREGTQFSVEVVSTGGDIDDIVTEINNDTLIIRHKDSMFGSRNRLAEETVNISLPALKSLSASGGSDVKGENTISGDRLEINISGGSDLSIEAEVDSLVIGASGGSDATLSGSVSQLRAQTSGGSDIRASGLIAKDADLTASGGSDIAITVTDRLTATASGGSDIRYSGDPGFTDFDGSGDSHMTNR
jgi:hypothetical protein